MATDKQRLDWLELKVVNVRDKLLYGSRDLFWSSPEGDEECHDYGPSDLRSRIDGWIAADEAKAAGK